MSTRYLQQLLQLKRIIVWCPEESNSSSRQRWADWFKQHPPKSQISFIDGPEITKESGCKYQTLLILVATSSSLPDYVDKLAKEDWPLVLLPKIELLRASKEIRNALVEIGKQSKIRIIGPDSAVCILPYQAFSTPTTMGALDLVPPIRKGNIAILTQSPSITACIRDWISGRHIGLSHLINVGGSSDVNIADLVDTLVQDPHCHALAIQIDRLRIPSRFISAIRSCSRHKPVMVLHTGRVRDFQTEQDPEIDTFLDRELLYQAAIERAGASSLDTLDDLFQALESLTKRRMHEGSRLTILGAGDGLEALAANHLYAANEGSIDFQVIKKPEWFTCPDAFPVDDKTLSALKTDADGLLIPLAAENLILNSANDASAWADRFMLFEKRLNRPLYFAIPGMVFGRVLREAMDQVGLATYTTPEQALNGFLSLARHDHATRLVDARVDDADFDELQPAEDYLKELIANNIPINAEVKRYLVTLIPGIQQAASNQLPLIRIAAGVARDPVFGPVIYLHEPPGHFPKLAVTLPPINQALGEDLLHRSATGRTLEDTDPEGFAITAKALVQFSRLLARVPEIASLKIQLSVTRGFVDTTINDLGFGPRIAQAITPYPESLDRAVILGDGRQARLRPLRPEDENAHRIFISKLSRATLRFRYFSDKQSFSARELAAMTHMDYSREVALIISVIGHDEPETLGVVRVIFDADELAAEFAMVVRDDLQRSGVGKLLLQAAVDIAKDRGARMIYGETMIENKRMQGLSRSLGFKVSTDFEAECVWMTLELAKPQDDWEASRLALITA
jgi:acetyltransferase